MSTVDDARRIVAALQPGWPRSVATLAVTTGLSRPLVAKALEKLADQGVVERVKRGEYRLPGGEG